jgi:hypothetical protein
VTQYVIALLRNIDDFLYKIFADVTFILSIEYELANRIDNQDCRRVMFEHRVKLLTLLSPQWGERESKEHKQILQVYPFDEDSV